MEFYFIFFQLRYWKSSEGRHKWEEVDVVVDAGDGYYLRDVRAAISGLPAYTALRAQVTVMNDHYTGPPSETIDFSTPEGGMYQTSSFKVKYTL
jgi:hypothetical protein